MSQTQPSSHLLERLKADRPLVAVELRPPPAGRSRAETMDTWIDLYHGVRRLAQQDTVIFITDNAVGAAEEENLQHLANNLADDVPPSRVVPFLTCKHTMEYCLTYAARAAARGFEALTVLGGDRSVGRPRCVEYAYQLRQDIRRRMPALALGGWANPHGNPVLQVDFLLSETFAAEFYLTQVVSHHSMRAVERFLAEARRRGVPYAGVFGVFLYRSARADTFQRLAPFFPVPAAEITREFEQGMTPEEICARSIRALREIGVNHVYVSNLGFRNPEKRYRAVLEAAET